MLKHKTLSKRRLPWPLVLLLQALAMLAAGALVSLSLWLGGAVRWACLWVLMPLAGLASACMATRAGLLNYAAWLVPPAMEFCANLLVWGYPPNVGPVFLCAFVALVGAAAGEVLKREARKEGAYDGKRSDSHL